MRYATITTWAEYFEKKEGISISENTIRNKLREAEKIGISGRGKVGRILRNSFYSEPDVREVCTDLLEDLPKADEDGFFEKEDIRYGTIGAWSRELLISKASIKRHLKKSNSPSIPGKASGGQKADFFAEPDIHSVCTDLLEDLPKADEDGFFEKEDIRYGTIGAWSRELPITEVTIRSCLKKAGTPSIPGKDSGGHKTDFYSEPDVRSVCADLLKDLPQADESGFFESNGKKYGTIHAWARVLSFTTKIIKRRLKKAKKKGIKGIGARGQMRTFYSEFDINEACSDLSKNKLPRADKNGFFEMNEVRYGTIKAWAGSLPPSRASIHRRLKIAKKIGTTGRGSDGRILINSFFSEFDIQFTCADFLKDLPQADNEGKVEINENIYRTVKGWAKILPVSYQSIERGLKKANIEGEEGRVESGHIRIFFSELQVRKAISNLLEEMPRADKNGFFRKEGVRYGFYKSWVRELHLSQAMLSYRLRKSDLIPTKGRLKDRKKVNFYAEPDIQELCSEHLRNPPVVDKHGFVEIEGVRYGLLKSIADNIGVPKETIVTRLTKQSVDYIEGKDRGGRIARLYLFGAIREVCSDLIQKRKANPKRS